MSEMKHVYVPVEIADRLEGLKSVDQMALVVDEYFADSRKEVANQLEDLDEQVLVYKALMIKAKGAFKEASTEMIEQSYQVWEAIDEKRPWVRAKVEQITDELKPIKENLDEIDALLKTLDFYRLEKVMDLLEKIEYVPDETKKMLAFLLNNYKG